MDIRRISLGFFCGIVLTAFCPVLSAQAAPKPASKTYHCYRLRQKNELFGDCTVYACPQALKIVFDSGKWMNIAQAPDWELYVLNPREKVCSHTPLNKWKANSLMLGSINDSVATRPFMTDETQKIAGLTAVKMVQGVRTAAGVSRTGSSFWVARDVKLPDQIYHVMCGNSLVQQLHRMPLRIHLNAGNLATSLDTTACSQVDLPASFFAVPKDFKVSPHPEDVLNTGVMDVVKDMTSF
ncbi:MAG: hypothetical protein JSS86_24125 [Cyanobacteria bacterium SZAS LIN-2]|nr:hypothetical protein [Cyanobacteria bacterium SZAS LIN-2]